MTQEQKAKAYDEALERAQKATRAGSDVAMDIVQYIFPQLAESEDERIRKALVEYFAPPVPFTDVRGIPIQKVRDWLEKQKEEEGYEAIPVESTLEYKLGFKAGKESEKQKETGIQWLKSDNVKNPEKPYIDKAGMFYTTDGRMCYASEIEKQKEQKHYWKPTETDVALFNKAVTTNKTLTPIERAQLDIIRSKFGCCRAVNCSGIAQKEQKPIEEHDLVAQLKEHLANTPKEQLEAEWKELEKWNHVGPTVEEYFGSIKPAEWSEEDEEMLQSIIKDFRAGKVSTIGQEQWLKSLSSNLKKKNEDVAKLCSNEWSEEDEKIAKEIEEELWYPGDFPDYPSKEESELYDDCQRRLDWFKNKLKSLRPQPKKELSIEKAIQWLDDTFYFLDNSSGRGRDCEITTRDFDSLEEMYDSFRKAVTIDSQPSWKPSEEQMKWLRDVIETVPMTCRQQIQLESLYNDLEKQKEQKPTATINGEPIPTENQSVDIPLAEWSEEDEENFKWFDKFFRAESVVAGGRDIPQDKYLWFKSLRPQPKPVWSEEDEEHRKSILARLDGMCKKGATFTRTRFAISEDEDWLKSLRPWKPPEEQMKALRECGECKRCIKELYEDLQKRYGTC